MVKTQSKNTQTQDNQQQIIEDFTLPGTKKEMAEDKIQRVRDMEMTRENWQQTLREIQGIVGTIDEQVVDTYVKWETKAGDNYDPSKDYLVKEKQIIEGFGQASFQDLKSKGDFEETIGLHDNTEAVREAHNNLFYVVQWFAYKDELKSATIDKLATLAEKLEQDYIDARSSERLLELSEREMEMKKEEIQGMVSNQVAEKADRSVVEQLKSQVADLREENAELDRLHSQLDRLNSVIERQGELIDGLIEDKNRYAKQNTQLRERIEDLTGREPPEPDIEDTEERPDTDIDLGIEEEPEPEPEVEDAEKDLSGVGQVDSDQDLFEEGEESEDEDGQTEEPLEEVVCTVCGDSFTTDAGRKGHKSQKHKEIFEDDEAEGATYKLSELDDRALRSTVVRIFQERAVEDVPAPNIANLTDLSVSELRSSFRDIESEIPNEDNLEERLDE